MRVVRLGDHGPEAAEIRRALGRIGILPDDGGSDVFDIAVDRAVRAFQQSRGLTADGLVGTETGRALDAARWCLGDRMLYLATPESLAGDDVRQLQERLLEMGYDLGRPDGVFGEVTAHALAQFQREAGLLADGVFGQATAHALRRLGRKVTGGRPQLLRETEMLRASGPALVGKKIVIDPGHGGDDLGVEVAENGMRWTEAQLGYDLAVRLEQRLAAVGVEVHLTRGLHAGYPDDARAKFANDLCADVVISVHFDGHPNPAACGVATYHFGTAAGVTSTVGERLASLVQREVVARTGLLNSRTHAKTWQLLRLTRMPAVRVEAGYLTSPGDLARIIDPRFRDTVADAIVAGVQRMYLPREADVATGTFDVSALRAALATD
ncbi:MAG TPA: N-acetylmuramoyl-L-alanine amidase [Micromonosporaceae bacterium]|nr:N-acetylmuramoyl-L-alanine amidase [Micromonosporaceae bacterium]